MAGTIATVNTSDKTVILGVRQAFKRQTAIGTSWTHVKFGMFYTIVPATNDDAASVLETMSSIDYKDQFSIGLKDAASDDPPFKSSSSCQFLGCVNNSASGAIRCTSNSAGTAEMGANGGSPRVRFAGMNGGSETAGAFGVSSGVGVAFPQYSSTNVNSFFGMRLIVSNLGLSNQTVLISFQFGSVLFSDVSIASLRSQMLSTAYSTTNQTAITWNNAGAALPLPDCFWAHLPFYNNRLRITAYGAARVS